MAPSGWLDAFQRRHPTFGFPLAVLYKFFDDQGTYLAALVTYYAFVSLFPVLLLLSSLLGYLLKDNPHLQQELFDGALGRLPVVGAKIGEPKALQGSGPGVTIAFIASLYGALGVAQAVQNAMNVAWGVPRNKRPNPILVRLRSLLLLVTAGFTLLGTTVVSTVTSSGLLGSGQVRNVAFYLLSVALNTVVLLLTFRLATALPLTIRQVLPGALIGGVVWQLLQSLGVQYVSHVVNNASDINGTFAFVLGLVAWIFLLATALVFCVEINVVRVRRLHPRSLLTPFTDRVDLTKADQRAYTQYAKAQRNKGFEQVDVTFEHDGQYATATRAAEAAAPVDPATPAPTPAPAPATRDDLRLVTNDAPPQWSGDEDHRWTGGTGGAGAGGGSGAASS